MRAWHLSLLIASITGLTLHWVVPSGAFRRATEPPGEAALAPVALPTDKPPILGVASCAAGGCHHQNGAAGSKGSEYSTWAAHDPHAGAYRALLGERSRRMAKQLWPDEPDRAAHPEREPLCLGCHTYPDAPPPRRPEGVGCESCHGPARDWVGKHHTREWVGWTSERKRRSGFLEMKDLRARAEVCVRCHVGAGDLDVNHDLIAAGHPRLRYEHSAYLGGYPRHWDRADDVARHRDHEARAWLVGQLVSARTSLELLATRAVRARFSTATWPEFAEYACAGCHADLTSQNRSRGAGRGEPPWGAWHLALLDDLAPHAPGGGEQAGAARLRDLMRQRVPPRAEAAAEARRLARALEEWLPGAERTPADAGRWLGLMRALSAGKGRHWDEQAQRYLGLAALQRGLADLDGGFSTHRPELAASLERVRELLGRSFPAGADSLYATPANHDPARVEEALRQLRELLR